jgi:hypothetical protein
MDGHFKFCTTPTVGVSGDDIYVNRSNRAAAGMDLLDTVLGASGFHPYPED